MWRVGRYGGRNHVCNIWWLSVKGCGCGEMGKFAFSHWLDSSPLQHWSHYHVMGDAWSQWEKASLPLSPHPHPLTDNHQISHTWLRPPYLPTSRIWSKSPPRGYVTYVSPYSQSYHSIFLFLSLYAKSFHGPRAPAVEPILSRDTTTDAYSRRVVPFGG